MMENKYAWWKYIFIGIFGSFFLLMFGLQRPVRAEPLLEYTELQILILEGSVEMVTCAGDWVTTSWQNLTDALGSAEEASEDGDDGEEFGHLQTSQVLEERVNAGCSNNPTAVDITNEMGTLIIQRKDQVFPRANPVIVIREICNNGIDDDFDKLIDCEDPDCAQKRECNQ